MHKKYLPVLVFLPLLIGMFWSIWFSPSLTPAFAMVILLLFLVMSIFSILEKHKSAEGQRQKIVHDISILILTLIFVTLLGWLAGTLVGRQAQAQFGAQLGLLFALIVSFFVGYWVKKGLGKVSN